ncbi:hypothetical protein K0M31_009640 [Melipona bicolor]|uniref:Uncharacterized protein n=1 Tax=Melipona bicolor TaxID=60889 RepID=A0AA40KJC2_9HYME|nr:hypothetical protein K0M31_009640 [Melipona bicolor]
METLGGEKVAAGNKPVDTLVDVERGSDVADREMKRNVVTAGQPRYTKSSRHAGDTGPPVLGERRNGDAGSETKKPQGWRIYVGRLGDGSSSVTKRFLERPGDDGVELDDDEARSRPAKMRR